MAIPTDQKSAVEFPDAASIARRFVRARRVGEALSGFPGAVPATLADAYRVQDLAIESWPDHIAGWKLGYIAPALRDASGDDRLLGPVFAGQCWRSAARAVAFPVFPGGFSAVEAEFVLQLQEDAPADRREWTPQQAAALPAKLFIGVEVAGSPLATINALGPRVVASDFGNNNGLIVGAEIAGWQVLAPAQLTCVTSIDGREVGRGGVERLPGGLLAAYAFALACAAKRGRPLKSGDLIASGNATGIHDIRAGEEAVIRFDGWGEIHARAIPGGAVQEHANLRFDR